MNCFITYMFTGLEHEKKIKYKCLNEMLSLYCTALGFVSKNEEYNPKLNIINSRYLKKLILQKVVKQQNIIKLNAVIIHFIFNAHR